MKYGCKIQPLDDSFNNIVLSYYTYCCPSRFDQFGRYKYKGTNVDPIWKVEESWEWNEDKQRYFKLKSTDSLLDTTEATEVRKKYFAELERSIPVYRNKFESNKNAGSEWNKVVWIDVFE